MANLPPELARLIAAARVPVAEGAPSKEEVKARHLYLRGWEKHPAEPCYYRRLPEGGFELQTEATLAARWPSVDLCESPIEVMYYAAIVGLDLCGFKMGMQVEVARYRLDFTFCHGDGRRICVEVDGHEFHERTKEQAQYDRSRDRQLALDGWRVLRFTGSEVFRDAAACARETISHMIARKI